MESLNIIGIVTATKPVEYNDSNLLIIDIIDVQNKAHQVIANAAFVTNIVIGQGYSIGAEQHIEGKTSYEDSDGETITHTKTGLYLNKIISYDTELARTQQELNLTAASLKAERDNAIKQVQEAATDSKAESLSKMLSGLFQTK